jgi:hypothetical protein
MRRHTSVVFRGLALAIALAAPPGRAADVEECAAAAESTQHLRAAGKLQQARATALVCGRESCPAMMRSDCQSWLSQIDAALPSIVVLAHAVSGDVTAVRLSVDGLPVTERLDGQPMLLDPGEHDLRFERLDEPGGAPITQHILLGAGEKNRRVEVVFQPPAPVAPPVAPAPAPAQPSPPPPPSPESRPVPMLSWVLGGVAVVALGAFGAFAVKAKVENDQWESQCGHGSCSPGELTTLHSDADVADIALAVGIAAATTATVLYLVRPTVAVDSRSAVIRLSVAF